jgi:hypothetical protein
VLITMMSGTRDRAVTQIGQCGAGRRQVRARSLSSCRPSTVLQWAPGRGGSGCCQWAVTVEKSCQV